VFGREASYQNSQRLVSEQRGHDKGLKSTCLASVRNNTVRLRIGGTLTSRALSRPLSREHWQCLRETQPATCRCACPCARRHGALQ
jgi:hypothetical protein